MSELQDYVVNDDTRKGIEKETSITFNGGENCCRIQSSQKTVVKSLCGHTDVEVDSVSVLDDDGIERVIDVSEHENENIIGVWCIAPLGLIKVQKNPRSRNVPSTVVSDQKEVDFNE